MNILHSILKGKDLSFPSVDPYFYQEDYDLMEDDAEENDNLLIGGTRQTAIPVFDNDVSYNLRRATYNDIDRLPVYKVKWNTFVGDTKGTKVCVSAGNECGICYERFKEGAAVTALPKCKHFFCYGCAARSLLNNASCPFCREAI